MTMRTSQAGTKVFIVLKTLSSLKISSDQGKITPSLQKKKKNEEPLCKIGTNPEPEFLLASNFIYQTKLDKPQ